MVINLATIIALLGCAFLLCFWVTVGKRKPVGFYLVCTGTAAIVACVRSDQKPATLIGILIAVAIVSGALLVVWGAIKAHRLARRRQVVYVPSQVQKPALRRVK